MSIPPGCQSLVTWAEDGTRHVHSTMVRRSFGIVHRRGGRRRDTRRHRSAGSRRVGYGTSIRLRSPGPPRRPRPSAREHPELVRQRAPARCEHARARRADHRGRPGGRHPRPARRRAQVRRHGSGHAGRPRVPLRRQVRQHADAGPGEDPRLRQPETARFPRAAHGARVADAAAARGLRPGRALPTPRTSRSTSRRRSRRARRARPRRASSSSRSSPQRYEPPGCRARSRSRASTGARSCACARSSRGCRWSR